MPRSYFPRKIRKKSIEENLTQIKGLHSNVGNSNMSTTCNVPTQIKQSELSGKRVPDMVVSYFGKKYTPNDVLWVLDSRHDIYCGMFNKIGDKFFSASQDGIIRIFDYCGRYLRLNHEIICHDYGWSIVSLVQSPDQRHLAFCSLCAKLNIANLEEESTEPRIFHLANDIGANDVFSLSFCGASSDKLLCGRNRGRVTICNMETGHCDELDVCTYQHADVNAVTTLDQTGNLFITGGDDTCIRMFDSRCLNNECIACFPGHEDGITYLDSKNDGRYFLSNSKDQTVRLWDLRMHSKAGLEGRKKPRETWDYRIHNVPKSYRNRPPNSRQSRSILTMTGHTVQYTLIRAKFSPLHSTGQQFAYAGSALGDWHIWDLTNGQLVSRNFVKTVTLRDVHWHPWDTRAITSGLNGSLTCWGYRRNEAKRKPLLFTQKTSTNITPPVLSEACGAEEEHSADESMDEQALYFQSETSQLQHRYKLNRAGFSYRFPRPRPVPSLSYTEIISDISTSSSSDEDANSRETASDSDHLEEVANFPNLVVDQSNSNSVLPQIFRLDDHQVNSSAQYSDCPDVVRGQRTTPTTRSQTRRQSNLQNTTNPNINRTSF